MKKLWRVKTESGSVYLFSENDGVFHVNGEEAVPNPNSKTWEGWQAIKKPLSHWPPAKGDVLLLERPHVAFGAGRLKKLSPVAEVVQCSL